MTEDALTALGELKEREADRWPAFLAMLGDLSDAGLQHLVQECFADAQAGRRECRAVLTDGRACRQLADHYRREIPLCTRHASRDAGTIVQEAGAIVWQLTADDRQLHNAGASNEPTVSLRQLRDLHAALTRLLATLDGVEPRTVAEQQHHNRMAQVRKTQKVYFARSRLGGDLIKIGIAVNVGRRMAALHAEAIAVVETKNAERLEKLLHARLAPFRTVGEWFEPSPQVLREVERFAGAA